MKKQPIQTAEVTQLSHDGRGIAHINGKTVFIAGALADETVSFQITRRHKNYDEAKIVEVIKPADNRVEPICEHYGICGGCSLQHLSIEQQWQFKQKSLIEQVQHFGKTKAQKILTPLTGPQQHYRYKARLAIKFDGKKNRMVIGFREKHSHYITDIKRCAILADNLSTILLNLQPILLGISIKNQIPQVEIAVGENNTVFILRHLKPLTELDKQQLIEFAVNNKIVLMLQPQGTDSIYTLSPADFSQEISYSLSEFNLTYYYKPWTFSQINPVINQQMVSKAVALLALQLTDKVLDLYCGFGNFTLAIAKFAGNVIGVEGEQSMVLQAKSNAMRNQLNNTEFYADNLMMPEQCGLWLKQSYDKILLDPPRTGALEMLSSIHKMNAKRIVYVSCNPATLARDIGILVNEYGYTLIDLGMMDMFPHTSHVESIALLTKE